MEYKTDGLNELSTQLNATTKKMGFDNNDVPLRIALIHSEVSETLEAYRKDKYAELTLSQAAELYSLDDDEFKVAFEQHVKDTFEDELADSLIRLLDLCGKKGVDIENHVNLKLRYNGTRGYKFGGKKF